jgi:SAM-dependent methyltransferase
MIKATNSVPGKLASKAPFWSAVNDRKIADETDDREIAASVYDSAFLSYAADVSLPSARVLIPLVVGLLHPTSVVDVGCGPGAWLRAFVENGVRNVRGIDGDYVDRSKLLIEPQYFVAADFSRPFSIEGKYDLAVCIEVAEHLPETQAEMLIERLTSAAPAVLFSAAIPGQGGTNHLNEQWPEYWGGLFAKHDFAMIDAFRSRIRDDSRIAYWVRQNVLLFVSKSALLFYPKLELEGERNSERHCDWVYADLYEKWLGAATRERGVKETLGDLRAAVDRAIRRRLKRFATRS